MTAGQEMWTPLEGALSPFKELARLNRRTVTGAEGNVVQLVLEADRCHVRADQGGEASTGLSIEIGFALGRERYAVRLADTDYRRDGRWDFDQIQSDISAGLQSGALQPGGLLVIAPKT